MILKEYTKGIIKMKANEFKKRLKEDGAKKLITYHIHNIIFLTGKQVKICIEKKNML